MAQVTVDCLGLRCPQPILKIAAKSAELNAGDTLEAAADCPTFEKDIRHWCERTKKTLMWIKDEGGGKKRCQIQF
jgi:tRNA 2-thiouridine synthesizing protein A